MRNTREREVRAVAGLDGPGRYAHFVKRVADEETAWGLWDDGWAMMTLDDGTHVFPMWPAREYAELLVNGQWAAYSPKEIPLADLMDELLPKLANRGVLPGVFPTPTGKGVTPSVEELLSALAAELENY